MAIINGTITVTNGSPTVTGSGTSFLTEYAGKDDILICDGVSSAILDVKSDTELTLTSEYVGTSGSGKKYAIIITNGAKAINELADSVTSMVKRHSENLNSITTNPSPHGIPKAGADSKIAQAWLPGSYNAGPNEIPQTGPDGKLNQDVIPITTAQIERDAEQDAKIEANTAKFAEYLPLVGGTLTGKVTTDNNIYLQDAKDWLGIVKGIEGNTFAVALQWYKKGQKEFTPCIGYVPSAKRIVINPVFADYAVWDGNYGLNITETGLNFNGKDVDIIKEQGSNANGTYIRYKNGLVICFGTKTEPALDINENYGGLYASKQLFQDMPTYINSGEIRVFSGGWLCVHTTGIWYHGVCDIWHSASNIGFRAINDTLIRFTTPVKIDWFACWKENV